MLPAKYVDVSHQTWGCVSTNIVMLAGQRVNVWGNVSVHRDIMKDNERGVEVPRWQGVPVLIMGKTLKFTAISATTLPGNKKIKWLGRGSKYQHFISSFFNFF